jgi:gamma-glutamyl:cysteine ligase YbdK (ATP-grasp superfamily)
MPLAQTLGIEARLAPLTAMLREGNQAMRWLALHKSGHSIAAILQAEVRQLERREEVLLEALATDGIRALG